MQVTVASSNIEGQIVAPSSKSYMQRAILLAALTKGKSELKNITLCEDTEAAINAARMIGAEIKHKKNELIIFGREELVNNVIDCHESGLCFRMFSAVAALYNKEIVLNGSGSLLNRPMGMVIDALKKVGVSVSSQDEKLPLMIQGPITQSIIQLDGSISSQFLTGMLIASAFSESDKEIIVNNLKSKPYIDMTLEMMRAFSLKYENINYQRFLVPGGQESKPVELFIEGDWSGAACILVAAAINGDIKVDNLNKYSHQADRALLEVFDKCGVIYSFEENRISVKRRKLLSFEFDATECPDLIPPLSALAAFCHGRSEIFGIDRLLHKESDRAAVLVEELSSLGVEIIRTKNSFVINGGNPIHGGIVDSHEDHRIAMACAVLGLNSEKDVIIENADCIDKSYPLFFEDLKHLGGNIS